MGIASGLKKAASRGFIKLGGTVTIKRETTSAYDLQKGQVHKNITTKTVQGAIENVVQREVNDLVTAQDKKLTISAGAIDFVPEPKDFVIIASVEYKVISVVTNEVMGEAVSFELYLRG